MTSKAEELENLLAGSHFEREKLSALIKDAEAGSSQDSYWMMFRSLYLGPILHI